jgi:hypothetical protein
MYVPGCGQLWSACGVVECPQNSLVTSTATRGAQCATFRIAHTLNPDQSRHSQPTSRSLIHTLLQTSLPTFPLQGGGIARTGASDFFLKMAAHAHRSGGASATRSDYAIPIWSPFKGVAVCTTSARQRRLNRCGKPYLRSDLSISAVCGPLAPWSP